MENNSNLKNKYKKVICKNNKDYPLSLQLNKLYEVIEKGEYYLIIDEQLEEHLYPKEIFENDTTL